MPRLAVLLVLLLALPVVADTPAPATPAPRPPAGPPRPAASPAPPADEGQLEEFVPSENVPADASVAFPHDI